MRVAAVSGFATVASATTYFVAMFAPGTEIHGAHLQAAGSAFYTGLSRPSTFCPPSVKSCPEVHGTLVYDGMAGMAVAVPGGQKIYVRPDGKVEFAQAQKELIPAGSFIGGWYNKTVVQGCGQATEVVDFRSTDGSNISGVALCPNPPSSLARTGASYTLYAHTADSSLDFCTEAIGLTLIGIDEKFGAYQYI
ncbi:hypothetical protein F4780DRAFT_782929 [Xylariomycetidae sp. FL0641]|nr:hypothetical protein F4780DRAFT_782929 [Xylariomycetidae sp. FL0641]